MNPSSNIKTPDDLAKWIKAAEPGDVVIYYTGNNAHGDVCKFAMRMCDENYIALVKRRVDTHGLHRFQFEAQRTKKVMK